MPEVRCFFQNWQNTAFCCLISQLYIRWQRISCNSFWIQNGLWTIFGCWVTSKTVLGVFLKKSNFWIFCENTKICFTYISEQELKILKSFSNGGHFCKNKIFFDFFNNFFFRPFFLIVGCSLIKYFILTVCPKRSHYNDQYKKTYLAWKPMA